MDIFVQLFGLILLLDFLLELMLRADGIKTENLAERLLLLLLKQAQHYTQLIQSYSVKRLWTSFLCGVVFYHRSVEANQRVWET